MIKKIIDIYKNIEKSAYTIMKNGLIFCFLLSLLSIFILLTYKLFIASFYLYYIGLSLFRLSIIFGIEFVICALVVDSLKKQLI